MSWPCRLVDPGQAARALVGDMWYLSEPSDAYRARHIAPEHAGKRPLVVLLPGPCQFAIFGPTWTSAGPGPSGWAVTGEPPLLTVTPSISIRGIYHGYIRDGVITDDIDGRLFNADGGRIYG